MDDHIIPRRLAPASIIVEGGSTRDPDVRVTCWVLF